MGLGLGVLGASLASTAWNIGSQLINWNREDHYNQKMWDRDDNAMQRRVADLQKAGLSPVLAAGGSGAGNSAPVLSSLKPVNNNPAMDYLSALQGKSDISKTNAETGMINLQMTSEQFKQRLLNNQIDYTKAMADNMSLQNAYYAKDMESTLNLRGVQSDKIKGEIAMNLQNTALLKSRTALTNAQTTYEQVRTDHERTLADQAKIQRDLLNFDLTSAGLRLYNDTYKANKGLLGNVFGDVRNLFTGFDIRNAIKNVDNSWYWDK